MSGGISSPPWVTSTLQECVEILDSVRVPINATEREARILGKRSEELFPYYGATGEVGKIDGYLFDEELIALGEDGVPFLDQAKAKAYMINGKTWVNNHAHVLKALDGISINAYLLHYLNQFDYREYVNGGTRLKLTQANMKKIPVKLPGLLEQKQIAAKLDELLVKVDSIKTRLDAIPAILKRFRQSVLAAAVSGRLTEDWGSNDTDYYFEIDEFIESNKKLRKIPSLSDDEVNLAKRLYGKSKWDRWQLYPLEQLVVPDRGIPYGIVQTGEHCPGGVRTVRCGDIKPLRIQKSDLKEVSPEISEQYQRTLLKGGEVLLAIRGTVGNAAVTPKTLVNANISREVALIPVRDEVDPDYIALLLQSPGGYRCLAEKVRGVAQKGINLADVKRFVTPLPILDEQREIVARVHDLFHYAEQIELRLSEGKRHVDSLTQSTLGKAFRGDLTAEWREQNPDLITGENSAESLLNRIKAERKSTPVKTRVRRNRA